MDLTFHCPHCRQELAVDTSAAGSGIECPTCGREIAVPQADITNIHPVNPISASAAAKIERHFSVPVHEGPAEVLLRMPQKQRHEEAVTPMEPMEPMEATAVPAAPAVPAGGRKIRIKIFRHSDCVEVGHDLYEEMVSDFLNQIGEANIISINALNYTHVDIGSQKILTDYAVQILYRG
jgi:DNA-directed RNA polymerase subunit RPC12/RpoP